MSEHTVSSLGPGLGPGLLTVAGETYHMSDLPQGTSKLTIPDSLTQKPSGVTVHDTLTQRASVPTVVHDNEEDDAATRHTNNPSVKSETEDDGRSSVTQTNGLDALTASLSEIKTDSPKPAEPIFEASKFPPSYKDNNDPREQACLKICKTMRRQFRDLYFDRRPLLLTPLNEFEVEKLVCTTINPTQLKYPELLDWQNMADFLAGHLDYDRLKPAHSLPAKMFAPQTVLERQRGHCFEYATVLTSMLIGAGYNAYVVSGYATREVCEKNLKYTICPFVEKDKTAIPKPISVNVCRYTVRPPRTFASRFLLRMEQKNALEKKITADVKKRQDDQARALLEAPPQDARRGWRIHAWVLVLPGNRDVTGPFFIEPTTGQAHAIGWNQYLGIESVWNHRNYYINVHREAVDTTVHVCKRTVPAPFLFPIGKMTWDMGDSCNWDFIFKYRHFNEKRHGMCGGGALSDVEVSDLPQSWGKKLAIPQDSYLRKFPTGKKTITYKQASVDLMADFLQPCGMVQKLWAYRDVECRSLYYTKETFFHRADLLTTRYFEQATGRIMDFFAEGRPDFLKEHHYYAQTPGDKSDRVIVFYCNKRTDELYRKEEGPCHITLYYGEHTRDKMYKKHMRFGPKGIVRENHHLVDKHSRPIEYVEEHFRRNPDVPADKDVHRIFYKVASNKINIEFHVAEHRIVGSFRQFKKPRMWWDDSQIVSWQPKAQTKGFHADAYHREGKELELFDMLLAMMDRERLSRDAIRVTERETTKLIGLREKEEANHKLLRPYSMAHLDGDKRNARLAEKAKRKAARIFKKTDRVHDYLEPNVWRLGLSDVTNKKQAVKVREDCLADLRDRLLGEASEMKAAFEELKKSIVKKQRLYHDSFTKFSVEEEEQHRADIMQSMFVAHILEQRISHLKEFAPVKYQALIDRLTTDPRIAKHLNN